MQMRAIMLVLCVATCSTRVAASQEVKANLSDSDFISRLSGRTTFADVAMELVKELRGNGLVTISFGLLGLFAVSLMQKENPEFFNTCTRWVESPFLLAQKNIQKLVCGGYSLTWNEVASWHNRVSRLLTPLTKATSMVDLSKDRRLRIMDQEDAPDQEQDVQWNQQVKHIERECNFLIKMLTIRLAFYKDSLKKKKRATGFKKAFAAPITVAQGIGKTVVRTSLTRNEEVAFGLEEAITYLSEIVVYCKSVPHFSALDKEHLKRLLNSSCTTFEHIGVLVDELSAADKNKKKIAMTADGTLARAGYAGGGYGGYDSQYGAGGS